MSAEPDRWVNARIEIVVALDGVTVHDSAERKQEAVSEIAGQILDATEDVPFAFSALATWEDVTGGEIAATA